MSCHDVSQLDVVCQFSILNYNSYCYDFFLVCNQTIVKGDNYNMLWNLRKVPNSIVFSFMTFTCECFYTVDIISRIQFLLYNSLDFVENHDGEQWLSLHVPWQ